MIFASIKSLSLKYCFSLKYFDSTTVKVGSQWSDFFVLFQKSLLVWYSTLFMSTDFLHLILKYVLLKTKNFLKPTYKSAFCICADQHFICADFFFHLRRFCFSFAPIFLQVNYRLITGE